MLIELGKLSSPFRPWRPVDGRVFEDTYALDTETTLIDTHTPGHVPDFVMGAASNGEQGFFLTRDQVVPFMQGHWSETVVFHNAAFDLKVLQRLTDSQGADIDLYDLVEHDRVFDTLLLHQLLTLATVGHTAFGQSTLEHCCQQYLGVCLPKDLRDSHGDEVRLSWGKYLGRTPRDIEPIYLEYLGKDVLGTFGVHRELIQRLKDVLEGSSGEWGYVSAAWLAEQIQRWGPQTHHIQLKASIVLDEMHALGIGLDVAAKAERQKELEELIHEKAARLRAKGYVSGEGSAKLLQETIAKTLKLHPHLHVPRTDTGRYETGTDALEAVAGVEPLFRELADYKAAVKLKTTYVEKMTEGRIHPSYDVLKNTGRTSSFGDINIQNLPRDNPKDPTNDPRIRRCFVPAPGHVFFDCDYKTIEMATLAQSVMGQLGVSSKMADAINAGQDLHRLVAGQATGKPPEQVSDDERQAAKAVNFGLPGGLGVKTLQAYAAATYNVQLSEEQAQAWRDNWFATFPEMKGFLEGGGFDTSLAAAVFFDLTPAEFNAATGTVRYYQDASDFEPQGWLAGMLFKALSVTDPITNTGRFYSPIELEYFWSKVLARVADLPTKLRKLVEKKKPCFELGKLLRSHFGRAPVFTLTGRLRAGATFCARHNTMFQGLAADGAKLALWQLWRAGYRIVAFVHDQVLIEVDRQADLDAVAEDIKARMIAGMKAVVPDVVVGVDGDFKARWTKAKEDKIDSQSTKVVVTDTVATFPTIRSSYANFQ